jgi:hypothetical protein
VGDEFERQGANHQFEFSPAQWLIQLPQGMEVFSEHLCSQKAGGKRSTSPFLSGSVVWSPMSSGFQIFPDEVVHERVGAVVA